MQHYFQLQYKVLNRQIAEFGLHPIVAHILLPIAFVGISLLIFYKTTFAPYIYVAFALAVISRLSARQRNEFLQIYFPEKPYKRLRLLENGLVVFPFLVFLCFKMQFLFALALLVAGATMALVNFNNRWNYSLPTPFSKRPFEFTVGFRNTWPILLIAYFLTYMGIRVDNFELAAFSLIVVFLTSLSYYAKPESIFFVWIFADTPQQFLLRKISTALLHLSLLCLPIIVSVSFFYPSNFMLLLGILTFACLYLVTIILAKYASFPRANSLPEVLILVACLVFSPILLVVIPYFYRRSIQKLNAVLA